MIPSYRYIALNFFAGLFDDPLLMLRIKPIGRSLLVDCGNMAHLSKRLFKSIDSVFVSHTHMDHFAGIDTLIRHVLVSNKTINLFGPVGIAEHLYHKMRGYQWNLVEDFYCRFKIHEVSESSMDVRLLSGPNGFELSQLDRITRSSSLIYEDRFVSAETMICDHLIPSLVFRFNEKSNFSVDIKKVEAEGMVPGAWLSELKDRLIKPKSHAVPVAATFKVDGKVEKKSIDDERGLYEKIKREGLLSSVGYITDIGYTEQNMAKIKTLMSNVTLLICECAFLKAQKDKARQSYHLCTDDVNELLRLIKPQFVLPMHLSKSDKEDQLYKELDPPLGCSVVKLPRRVSAEPLVYSGN